MEIKNLTLEDLKRVVQNFKEKSTKENKWFLKKIAKIQQSTYENFLIKDMDFVVTLKNNAMIVNTLQSLTYGNIWKKSLMIQKGIINNIGQTYAQSCIRRPGRDCEQFVNNKKY